MITMNAKSIDFRLAGSSGNLAGLAATKISKDLADLYFLCSVMQFAVVVLIIEEDFSCYNNDPI